jgi:hypothetical protein
MTAMETRLSLTLCLREAQFDRTNVTQPPDANFCPFDSLSEQPKDPVRLFTYAELTGLQFRGFIFDE